MTTPAATPNTSSGAKRENILAKVRKMMDLAEGSDKQGEIDAALQAASNLMARYAIEQAEVDALRTDGKPEQIVERRIIAGKNHSPMSSSLGSLFVVVANNTRCTVYRDSSAADYTIVLVGYESDAEYAEMLWTSLCLQMDKAHEAAKRAKRDWVHGRTFRKNFNAGFTGEASARLKAMRAETMREIESASSSSALVLIDREQAVKDHIRHLNLHRTSSGRSEYDAHARQQGRRAAARADYSGGRGPARVGSRGQIGS